MKQKTNKELIKQELSEILAKYYDGSFARLMQEYIRISGMREEEVLCLINELKLKMSIGQK